MISSIICLGADWRQPTKSSTSQFVDCFCRRGMKVLWIGSEEMVSINQLAKMIMGIANKRLSIKHIEGPLGVRGRNSDNRLIKKVLGWAPTLPLKQGLTTTYHWIEEQVKAKS